MLPWLDLIYFDLKLIDAAESERYSGRSSKKIFDNFSTLIKTAKIPVIPRIPLIPGITATERNLKGIAAFLAKHSVKTCALMPYNPLWLGKLENLGISAPRYTHSRFMTTEELKACADYFTHGSHSAQAQADSV